MPQRNSRGFLRSLPIRAKLIGIVVSVTLVCLTAGFSFIIREDIHQFRSALLEMTIVNARLVGDYSVSPLAFGDREGAQKILERLSTIPSVTNARIYDNSDVLFASFDREQKENSLGKDLPSQYETGFQGRWLNVYQPIVYKGERYGTIHLRATTELLNEKIATYSLTMALLLAVLVTVAYLLARGLQRVISHPIHQLADISRRITREGNYSFRVVKHAEDEIGSLYDAFNEMMDHIFEREKERDKALEELFHEKERAQVTLKSIGDAVITTDIQGRIQYLNPIAEQLTGWRLEECQGMPLDDVFQIINELTRQPTANPVMRCLEQGRIIDLADHIILIRRDGGEIAIEDSAAPIRDQSGRIIGVVMVFHDVTESRRLIQQISYQARHDSLTGLINRHEFEQQLARVIDSARVDGSDHALLYMDLDQFKVVNDTCGHLAGDELLRQITNLLKSHLRSRDILARFGGDEFAVLLEHCSPQKAAKVAEVLRDGVRSYRFVWEGNSFAIGVSIGIVPVDAHSGSLSDVLSTADSACYAAKEAGRNRIHSYHEDAPAVAKRNSEMRWVSRITQALEQNRFILALQPIAPIGRDHVPNSHYEVLIRMQEEDGSIIMPGAFLSAAERYNMMPSLDRWVISRTLNWLAEDDARVQDLEICAINLSGHSFTDDKFLSFVELELERTKVPPHKICFEVTETATIINLSSAMQFIRALRRHGCRFALDDFGAGMSSFRYLKNLPVDYLKIDGNFVRDIDVDPMNFAMVKSINDIGHVMGIKTIAEFVETPSVMAKLQAIQVDYAQGYLIGAPQLVIDGRA